MVKGTSSNPVGMIPFAAHLSVCSKTKGNDRYENLISHKSGDGHD